MFTGIVEAVGRIESVDAQPDGRRLRIETNFEGLSYGQSISVSGVCLTVEDYGSDWFEIFLATETIDRTYLGDLEPGDPVNLERALPADGRLDGHVVQGHVDGTAAIRDMTAVGEDWQFTFSLPDGLSQYVVEKGSIAVDGISLTVAAIDEVAFSVAIVPETYDVTNLSEKEIGDPVHLEVDVMAKYVENLLEGYVDGDN